MSRSTAPRLPFAAGVGVEEERFFFIGARAPTVPEFNALIEHLAATGPFSIAKVGTVAGDLLEARLDTKAGPLVIKHDYCTHIVEVAFPPVRSLVRLENMYEDVWERLRHAAAAVEGAFSDQVYLPRLPEGFVFAELTEYVDRTSRLIDRELPPRPLASPHFLAQMVATQVTLEIDLEYFFAHLRGAYSLLYLVPVAFSAPVTVADRRYWSVRPVVYRDNLPDHPLNGFPRSFPKDLAHYRELLRSVPHAFRDYSFLAMREHGLVEFRLGDAQSSFHSTANLVALTLLLMLHAADTAWEDEPSEESFYAYCEQGLVPDRFSDDVDALERMVERLPAPWRRQPDFLAARI